MYIRKTAFGLIAYNLGRSLAAGNLGKVASTLAGHLVRIPATEYERLGHGLLFSDERLKPHRQKLWDLMYREIPLAKINEARQRLKNEFGWFGGKRVRKEREFPEWIRVRL